MPIATVGEARKSSTPPPQAPYRWREINYPATSSGVLNAFRHAGPDPASTDLFLDSSFRGNDEKRGKPRGMYPKGFNPD